MTQHNNAPNPFAASPGTTASPRQKTFSFIYNFCTRRLSPHGFVGGVTRKLVELELRAIGIGLDFVAATTHTANKALTTAAKYTALGGTIALGVYIGNGNDPIKDMSENGYGDRLREWFQAKPQQIEKALENIDRATTPGHSPSKPTLMYLEITPEPSGEITAEQLQKALSAPKRQAPNLPQKNMEPPW